MSSVNEPIKGIAFQLMARFIFAGYTVVCSLLTRHYLLEEVMLFKHLGSFLVCMLLFRPSLDILMLWVLLGGGLVFISNTLYIIYQKRKSERGHAKYRKC